MKHSPDEDVTYYPSSSVIKIIDDPYYFAAKNIKYLNRKFPGKVMSVDNDIIAKAYQSSSLGFSGIEFNIASESLKIGHYPEYTFDITLDEYLETSAVLNMERLWFDFKSPKGKNINGFIERMEDLNHRFGIKSKALIESWEDGLDKFSELGWQTTYYINLGNFEGCGTAKKCAKALLLRIVDTGANSISFFANDYPFVKQHLEPLLSDSFNYHVFGFGYDHQVFNPNMIKNIENDAIFNDPRVKTILLDGDQLFKFRQ